MNKIHLFKSLAVFLLVGGLTACEEPAPEKAEVTRPVKLLTVAEPASTGVLEFSGVVSASQSTEIGFEVAGQVIEFLVREGEQVAAGQVLAKLDTTNFQAALDAAKARLEAATANFKRYEELVKDGWVSQQKFEQEKLQYEAADASFRSVEKAFNDTSLRAPYSGVIARTIVENFENVQAKAPILELHDVTSLEIRVSVPERDLVLATPGQSVAEVTERLEPTVTIGSLPDLQIPARLKEIETVADAVTRTYSATFAFAPPEGRNLLPGMTGRVTVHPQQGTAGRPSIRVPASAVVADAEGRAFMWLLDEDTMTVSKAYVEIGQLMGADSEIVAGLTPGQRVAVSGVNHLRDGVSVRPLDE